MANRYPVITCLFLAFASALALASACAAGPRVVSVDPPDGAKDVRTSSNIRVDFDSVMDASTITTSTVLLDGKPLAEVPGAEVVHPDGKSAVLLLRLVQNNSYRFTLTTAIRDSAGEALAEAYTWQFVTASRVDDPDTPVRVFARYPRMNDFGIPTNAPITMTFTTEMDPESFGAGSILVRKTTGGQAVAGKVTVKGRRVVFRPDAPLAANQPYEAVVSNDVKSRWGAVPLKDSSWQFTTGDGPGEGPVIADAWYESYADRESLRLVFHAAVENLVKPDSAAPAPAKPLPAPGDPGVLAEGHALKAAVVSLEAIAPSQPLSTQTSQSAKDMPVTTGPTTVVTAAYTHGGGAGQGNSVEGSTWKDPTEEKIEAALDAALEGPGAVGLDDSGDLIGHGDREKGDGVYSARLTLEKGFPVGQALVAFTVVAPEGKKTGPVTMAVYVTPPSPEAAAPASRGAASPAGP